MLLQRVLVLVVCSCAVPHKSLQPNGNEKITSDSVAV